MKKAASGQENGFQNLSLFFKRTVLRHPLEVSFRISIQDEIGILRRRVWINHSSSDC